MLSQQRDYWPTEDWKTPLPDQVRWDTKSVADITDYIQNNCRNITSVLVIKNGYLVYEVYAQECSRDTTHYVFSVTKSVLSAVVGIAVREGFIKHLEQPISDFFPEHKTGKSRTDIRIKHLLTMTAGLAADDSYNAENPTKHALWLPRESPPGAQFQYSDHVARLLSAIVTISSSGRNSFHLAKQYLLAPLGLHSVRWPDDSQGHSHGAAGLTWTSRDMAKFGYLYLNDGIWDGEEILPSAWIEESRRVHNQGGPPVNDAYGYMWWIGELSGYKTYYAAGLFFQRIYIVPQLDAVFVLTCNEQEGDNPRVVIEQLADLIVT